MANYLKRRAKRIFPPYYAALVLSMAVLIVINLVKNPLHTAALAGIPDLSMGSVASHLLMVHNWFAAWNNSINLAMWSVATEWQIYFFFPLLLLPVWRRAGAVCILVGAVVGLLPHFLLPTDRNLDWAC